MSGNIQVRSSFKMYLYILYFTVYGSTLSYDYKNSNLTGIPTDIQDPQSVTVFRLANNGIISIEENSFTDYRNLTFLALANNKIKNIASSAFNNTKISELSLSKNQLQCVPDFTCIHKTLTILNLNHNRLGLCSLHRKQCNVTFQKLKHIYLVNNILTYIPRIVLCSSRVRHLNLRNNRLTVIDDLLNILSRPIGIYKLVISNNPLVCDCHALWIKKYETKYKIKKYNFRHKCGGGEFKTRRWNNVSLSEMTDVCIRTTILGTNCEPA